MGDKFRNEDESIMNSELKAIAYLKVIYEDAKKKNNIMKNKVKSNKFYGQLKMLCFVISLMFNVYFILKCNVDVILKL